MMAAQHDLRHRIQAAEQLLQGTSGQAADAASRLLDDDDTAARFMTGSMAVDAVLTAKAAAMDKAGIAFHFVPYPLYDLPMDETSFAILLSNLLDNAR